MIMLIVCIRVILLQTEVTTQELQAAFESEQEPLQLAQLALARLTQIFEKGAFLSTLYIAASFPLFFVGSLLHIIKILNELGTFL